MATRGSNGNEPGRVQHLVALLLLLLLLLLPLFLLLLLLPCEHYDDDCDQDYCFCNSCYGNHHQQHCHKKEEGPGGPGLPEGDPELRWCSSLPGGFDTHNLGNPVEASELVAGLWSRHEVFDITLSCSGIWIRRARVQNEARYGAE